MKSHSIPAEILAKWRLVLVVVVILKVLVMVMISPQGDLINWTGGTSVALQFISNGRFPPISATGVYGPIFILLTPFFWLWTKLPIEHPPITSMLFSSSIPARFLSLLMKLPALLADVATGVIVFKVAGQVTHSQTKSRLASLVWYTNLYNVYWINAFGAMDVIPTVILMLAIYLGSNRWFRSGLCLSAATILRIFPIFTFPFFLAAIRTRSRAYGYLMVGYLLPLISGLVLVYVAGAGTLNTITQLPKTEYWLLDFLGGNLTNPYVRLALVLAPVQFFVTILYWKKSILLHLVTVSLLALLIGAQNTPPHHFLWVSSLLTICVVLNPDELWIFILTFITASLHLTAIFGIPVPALFILGPFIGGCFYAAKATYLVKINLRNILN